MYFKNSLPQGTEYSLVHYTISNFTAMMSLTSVKTHKANLAPWGVL